MKLQHLRFFTAVVECGGVIKASERLHITQPAISAGLKALEDELGGALFHRGSNRRLSLTPAGRRFYRHALEILRQCDAAQASFAGDAAQKQQVRIGILDTLSQGMIVELVERLAEHHPEWEVVVWEGSVQRLTTWLGQGRIDLAWTNVHEQNHGQRMLWRESLVAVIPGGHPFAALPGRIIDLQTLAAEPFVHRSRCELDALGRAQLRAAGISLRVVARAERDELAFQWIRMGRGITLAPRSLVPADLIRIEVEGLAVTRSVGLLWQENSALPIIDSVAAVAADLVA